MLTIRITGVNLQTARRLLGGSLQEMASRSGVNWLTIKKYEGAGDYHPPATVGALNRLVDALEDVLVGTLDAIFELCCAGAAWSLRRPRQVYCD
jgi:predicted transcriptional regulator